MDTETTKPKFKNKDMQRMYDGCLAMAADKSSELYNADGTQHTGSNGRCAFWEGYNGMQVQHRIPRGTPLWAAYQAGLAFKRRKPKDEAPVPSRVHQPAGN